VGPDYCVPLFQIKFEKLVSIKSDEIRLGFDGGKKDYIVINETFRETYQQYLQAELIDSGGKVFKNFTKKDGEF
jgi:hypothetical protein